MKIILRAAILAALCLGAAWGQCGVRVRNPRTGLVDCIGPVGSGDVVGPGSATDNAIVRFDGTTGKLIQNSAVTIADTTGTITTPGVFVSTIATGTAPLTVSSTTVVANLNASALGGATFAAPGAIGGGTPGTGAFTTGSYSGLFTALNLKRASGTPEGAVTGVIGDIFQRTNGGAGTSLYIKESGSGNTGWTPVNAACATCVLTDQANTYGAFAQDFTAATVSLPAIFVHTDSTQTYTAGATQTFVPSATLYAMKVSAGQPSVNAATGLYVTAGGRYGGDDGSNIYHFVGVAGSGVTPPAAPSAGVAHFAGSTFNVTSSLIVAADITAATITAAKMAAATFDAQTDAATITWAIASVLNAQATVTLGGNRTLNITGPVIGGNYVFKITQDGTGSRTLTKGTGCTWKELGSGAATFGLSTTAGAIDVVTFTYDGTNCLASVGKAYGG